MNNFQSNYYVNGYIERKSGGFYEGLITIDGVNLGKIEGTYFKDDGKQYLWLKRKFLLEYDFDSQSYYQRSSEPRWEAYLQKQNNNSIAYKGTFIFLRFKYSITGIWDSVLGKDKHRLNLFVERLPMNEQIIINSIKERYKEYNEE